MKVYSTLLMLSMLLAAAQGAAAAEEVLLAQDGKARWPIVVATNAPARTRQAAAALAEYLGQISRSEFVVTNGDGSAGVVVGVASDFTALPFQPAFATGDFAEQERYILRSLAQGVFLVGATEAGVEHAVWDFLYRLGYRQYFPTKTWEIVPVRALLRVRVDADEKPDFITRVIGYDCGYLEFNKETFRLWNLRNRVQSDLVIICGHHYQAILAAKKKDFDAHPEYLGLVDGERRSSKFCVSNPGLRQLIANYAVEYFDRHPKAACMSMEPSDGVGWCQCAACAALGSISDRAVTLANVAADAVSGRHKLIGMLAYGYHATPPAIPVRSNVMVHVTTHQARSALSLEERIQGWRRQGAGVGVSDAYGTFVWDYNLPARQRGSSLAYLRATIPRFHELGVRQMSGWTSGSWGPVGLGNYLAARLLWDVDEAGKVEELLAEFLEKSFGPARAPMEKVFRLLYRLKPDDQRPMLSAHLLGTLYRLLAEARQQSSDPAMRARINDLILYTRYVELMFDYQNTRNEKNGPKTNVVQAAADPGGRPQKSRRQQAFEQLLEFNYRIRKTEMLNSKALYVLLEVDKSLSVPAELALQSLAAKYQQVGPLAEPEIAALAQAGIRRNKLLDFEPIPYSAELVPALALKLPSVPPGKIYLPNRQHPQRFYTWITNAPATIVLTVTCGLFDKSCGAARAQLHSPKAAAGTEDQATLVAETNAPPDKAPHEVALLTPYEGLHWIEVLTLGDIATVSFKGPNMARTYESGLENQRFWPVGWWSLYFYVPAGTPVVGGYFSECTGKLLDGAGQVVYAFDAAPQAGYFKAPVPAGQAGRLWKFDNCSGQRLLMTAPPFLARSAEELLLPAEVVERELARRGQK